MSKIINKNKKTFSSKELSLFCEQVAMLLDSGILLHDGIKMLAEKSEDIKSKEIFQSVANELLNNSSLEQALEKTGQFPDYMIYLTKIGSETGMLDKTMRSLAYYYNRQDSIKENIKSAILYPFILIAMMTSVLLFLSIKVLPIFKTLLNNLGADLSGIVNFIMVAGSFISRFSALFICIILLIIICIIYFTKSNKGKEKLMDFVWQLNLFETLSLSIFTSSLSTVLASGDNIDKAFELSSSGIINKKVKNRINECIRLMNKEHLTFAEAMEKSNLFTNMPLSILKFGINVGSLDSSMKQVSDMFNEEFENKLARRISIIEPISVAIISVLIGTVLVSVMLPLLSIMSIIGA